MSLDQFHPFCASEIRKVPQTRGAYVLFQIQVPTYAAAAPNLRRELFRARKRFPTASHFAIETGDGDQQSFLQRVREVQEKLKLVRTGAFVGGKS